MVAGIRLRNDSSRSVMLLVFFPPSLPPFTVNIAVIVRCICLNRSFMRLFMSNMSHFLQSFNWWIEIRDFSHPFYRIKSRQIEAF